MERTYIEELDKKIGEKVRIDGFVEKNRNLQYVAFLVIKDKTNKVQVTIEKETASKELLSIVDKLTPNSTVTVIGTLNANEKVKLRGMEIIPESIIITSLSSEELPLNYNDLSSTSLDNRLDNRFLDLRNEKNALIFEVQTTLVKALRDYLYERKFIEIHTPKLIKTASESGSSVFEVKYFKDKAYLAQSPQFYKQMAMASGMERIFEVAPAFRAENSNSYRHATEFTSFDLEMSYIDSYKDVAKVEEEMLVYALKEVKEKHGDKIKELWGVDVVVPTMPFPTIKLPDLCKELEKRYGYQVPEEEIGDMNAEMEKLTSRYAKEVYNHEFIFVTDFSKVKRPFYHMREDDVPQGYDLIWKGCEITTGAQREHRYDILVKQCKEKGLDKDVEFYLEFFKYGCPPHGGFAIGVDRLTMLLLGIPSLKETMFLFRGPSRITP